MRENLLRSGAISLVGSSLSAVSALVIGAIVGRSMGAAGTGIFFQAVALFSILVAALRLGTSSGLIWARAQQLVESPEGGYARIVAIAVVPVALASGAVGVLLATLAEPLGRILSPEAPDELADVLRLLAVFVPLAAVMGALQTAVRVLRGVLSFSMLQDIAVPLSRLLGVGLAAAAGASVIGAVTAWLVSIPLWLLVTMGWVVQPLLADRRAKRRSAMTPGRFWRFSGARAVGVTLEFGLDWVDVLIVAALRSPAEAGVYAVASRCVQAGRVVDRAVRVAVAPTISWHLARGDTEEASSVHLQVTRIAVLISWPFYLTLVTMGPAVLGIFGPEFREGAAVLALLGLVMMAVVSAGMLQSILLMGGRSTWQVYNKSVALTLSISLNLALVPTMGILGAAMAWAAVVAVDTAIAAWLVHSRMGVWLAPQRLLATAVLPVVIFGGLGAVVRIWWGVGPLELLSYVGLSMVLYAGALVLMRNRLGLIDGVRILSGGPVRV